MKFVKQSGRHSLVQHCTFRAGLLGCGEECILILLRKMPITSLG